MQTSSNQQAHISKPHQAFLYHKWQKVRRSLGLKLIWWGWCYFTRNQGAKVKVHKSEFCFLYPLHILVGLGTLRDPGFILHFLACRLWGQLRHSCTQQCHNTGYSLRLWFHHALQCLRILPRQVTTNHWAEEPERLLEQTGTEEGVLRTWPPSCEHTLLRRWED